MVSTASKQILFGKPVFINRPHGTHTKAKLILAHGAGAPMDSVFMDKMAAVIADHSSIEVIRFEFDYMQQRRSGGSKRPPPKVSALVEEWSQWLSLFNKHDDTPLLLGGKSMGGRIATLMDSDPGIAQLWQGVICLGYPFHPARKPSTLRTAHLAKSKSPTLMIQGTRDPLGNRAEVATYNLPQKIFLEWVESADHDLKPLKASGVSHDQALLQACSAITDFTLKLNRE